MVSKAEITDDTQMRVASAGLFYAKERAFQMEAEFAELPMVIHKNKILKLNHSKGITGKDYY